MENLKAIQLIDKILKNLDKTGINNEKLVDDIKELRTYAIEQKVPLLVKVLRLTYEHIEEHQSFLIPIPGDEAIDDEVENEEHIEIESSPVESLKYLLSLARNLDNKGNIADLREYKALLA